MWADVAQACECCGRQTRSRPMRARALRGGKAGELRLCDVCLARDGAVWRLRWELDDERSVA
jgi:hypothetical protein